MSIVTTPTAESCLPHVRSSHTRRRWPVGETAQVGDSETDDGVRLLRVIDAERQRADPESGVRESWLLELESGLTVELDPETGYLLDSDGDKVGELA